MKQTYLKIKEYLEEMDKIPEFSYVVDKIALVSEPSEFCVRNATNTGNIKNFIIWIEMPVFGDVKRYDFNGTKEEILKRIIEVFDIGEK